jgi:hypothetical protein
MKYILLFLILISQGLCGELQLMTDSYEVDPAIPTISHKKTNDKFVKLSEIENPYCEGVLDKDSTLYAAFQKDKEDREFMRSLVSSLSTTLTREQLDNIIIQAQPIPSAVYRPCGCGKIGENGLEAPEPNSNSLVLIGLTFLFFIRRNI